MSWEDNQTDWRVRICPLTDGRQVHVSLRKTDDEVALSKEAAEHLANTLLVYVSKMRLYEMLSERGDE